MVFARPVLRLGTAIVSSVSFNIVRRNRGTTFSSSRCALSARARRYDTTPQSACVALSELLLSVVFLQVDQLAKCRERVVRRRLSSTATGVQVAINAAHRAQSGTSLIVQRREGRLDDQCRVNRLGHIHRTVAVNATCNVLLVGLDITGPQPVSLDVTGYRGAEFHETT